MLWAMFSITKLWPLHVDKQQPPRKGQNTELREVKEEEGREGEGREEEGRKGGKGLGRTGH